MFKFSDHSIKQKFQIAVQNTAFQTTRSKLKTLITITLHINPGRAESLIREIETDLSLPEKPTVRSNSDQQVLDKIRYFIKRLEVERTNPKVQELLLLLKPRSVDLAYQAVLKTIFKADHNALKKAVWEIQNSGINNGDSELKTDVIINSTAYIYALNMNQQSYDAVPFKALHLDEISTYKKTYATFANIDQRSEKFPEEAILRRNILFQTALLKSYLQRDPIEVKRYDEQMLSAIADKRRMLGYIQETLTKNAPLAIIDIGPAGGAVIKAIAEMAAINEDQTGKTNKLQYIGVELDPQEILKLNNFMENQQLTGKSIREFYHKGAKIIEGNALDLQKVLESQWESIGDKPVIIIASSVIHEVYSYAKYPSKWKHDFTPTTMIKPWKNGQYNPQSVYKYYEESMLALAKKGGVLSLRDGAMTPDSEERVSIKLQDLSWLSMFNMFVQDSKYQHLKAYLTHYPVSQGEIITLPGKYIQEFMLKANWGPESFGNEINEVYNYLKPKDHLQIIFDVANKHNLKVVIMEESQYTQSGYPEHITSDKIKILSGFSSTKGFPPTNMQLQIRVEAKKT